MNFSFLLRAFLFTAVVLSAFSAQAGEACHATSKDPATVASARPTAAASASPAAATVSAPSVPATPSVPGPGQAAPASRSLRASFTYEGRAALADSGDGAGRQGVFNILWASYSRPTGEIEFYALARAFGFEGDAFVKQYNAMPESGQASLHEARFAMRGSHSLATFGLFHAEPAVRRPLDLRFHTYCFDPMNAPANRRGQPNLRYERFAGGATIFADYTFDSDYPNSLKIIGADYRGLSFARIANRSRQITWLDYSRRFRGFLTAGATFRKNAFSFIGDIDQSSFHLAADLASAPAGIPRPLAARNARYEAEFMVNSTANSYFLAKRNLSDSISSGVLFPYQKTVLGQSFSFDIDPKRKTRLALSHHAAISPLYSKADGLLTEIPLPSVITVSVSGRCREAEIEVSAMGSQNDDGSETVPGKSQFVTRVRYPF